MGGEWDRLKERGGLAGEWCFLGCGLEKGLLGEAGLRGGCLWEGLGVWGGGRGRCCGVGWGGRAEVEGKRE